MLRVRQGRGSPTGAPLVPLATHLTDVGRARARLALALPIRVGGGLLGVPRRLMALVMPLGRYRIDLRVGGRRRDCSSAILDRS